jgi:hypothetical protein
MMTAGRLALTWVVLLGRCAPVDRAHATSLARPGVARTLLTCPTLAGYLLVSTPLRDRSRLCHAVAPMRSGVPRLAEPGLAGPVLRPVPCPDVSHVSPAAREEPVLSAGAVTVRT